MTVGQLQPETPREPPDTSQTVFRTDITTIDYIQAGGEPSSRLAITFSSYGDFDVSGRAARQAFFTSNGWDVLVVSTTRNNWFQDLSADEFAEVVSGLPTHMRVLTYGSNMGGYGAIYFAAVAGARQVIAVSPQISNDPAVIPWDKRWIGDARSIEFRHTPIPEQLAGHDIEINVIYDPQTPDGAHVEELKRAVPGVIAVPLHYSGHPADAMLQDLGLLEPALERLVGGARSLDRLTIRERRRRSPAYLIALAAAARRHRRSVLAETLLTLAADLGPRADVLFAYSDTLLDNGKVEAALIARRNATAMMPDDAHRLARLGHLEEMTGDLPEAAHHYARAIQLDRDVIDFHVSQSRVLRAMLEDRPEPGLGQPASTVAGNAEGLAELDRLRHQQRDGVISQRDVLLGLAIPIGIVLAFLVIGRTFGWV